MAVTYKHKTALQVAPNPTMSLQMFFIRRESKISEFLRNFAIGIYYTN